MSYDLYFRGDADLDAVRAYLTEHGHAIRGDDAVHENKATGVYWSFSLRGGRDYLFAFSLNYYRPHVFGLEAERTITPLVERFGLAVSDPQIDGMDDRPYTPEEFLRGWNYGNRSAHRTVMGSAEPPRTLPAARNAGIWRWNYAKDIAFDELARGVARDVPPCFVPTIMTFAVNGEHAVTTCVVWDGGNPIAIPDVDLVVAIAKERVFAAPRAQFVALLDLHSRWSADRQVGVDRRLMGLAADVFNRMEQPALRRMGDVMRPIQMTRIPTARVLDVELVEAARLGPQLQILDPSKLLAYICCGAAMPSSWSPRASVACTAPTSARRAARTGRSSVRTRSAGSVLPAVYQRENSPASSSR